MRSGVRDLFSKRATDWRRVGLRSLPFAGVAVAGAGCLAVQKQRSPPAVNLLAQRASFECHAPPSGVADALEAALARLGAHAPQLRLAASRLKGPFERDIAAAEYSLACEANHDAGHRRDELYSAVVAKWHAAGHLSAHAHRHGRELMRRGVDPVTHIDESYGRDLGCEVPLCMLRAKPKNVKRGSGAQPKEERLVTLKAEDWPEAAEALRQHGIVVLRGLLSPEQVQALRSQMGVLGSALDLHSARNRDVLTVPAVREFSEAKLIEQDPEIESVTSTTGRQHFYLRGGPVEEVVKHVQAGAMPLVWEHLANAMPTEDMYPWISEVQMLVTDPCAVDQFWHMDNASPGLTLYVPLTDVPEDLGPMHFLPGSHHLFTEDSLATRVQRFLGSFMSSNGVVVGKLAAGDALIHNASIIHKGSLNRKYDRSCVALVFRYDFERPPGVGAFTTQFVSLLGGTLAGIQRFYSAMPGPTDSSDTGAT